MPLRSGLDAISALMEDFRAGDKRAAAHLVELLYPELKRMAQNRMRQEGKGHSWQPTLLVNELYLELLKIKGLSSKQHASEDDKAAFLALAGQLMRRLLIHHTRPLSSKARKVPLDTHLPIQADTAIPEIEDLLCRLAQVKPEMRTIVEMKVFHGLTADEISAQLGCATVTVNRHWQFARHWLRKEFDH